MALNAPYTPNTVIQSTQVSNDLLGLANGSNDTTTNSLSTFRTEDFFDHVISGLVWSGDSYAVNRNASMTAAICSIGGTRYAISAVTARTFTASRDTYIDVSTAGALVYTEVTNNAASPALTSGYIRVGIIITGATTIAAATSINQGQETMILPIAASIPYAVTDSLGNLICSRDPNRKLLGYRQGIANTSTSSGALGDITGLNLTVNIPVGRKVTVSGQIGGGYNSTSTDGGSMALIDVTAASLQLAESLNNSVRANGEFNVNPSIPYTPPSSGVRNFKAQMRVLVGGTFNTNASTTAPIWVKVEL